MFILRPRLLGDPKHVANFSYAHAKGIARRLEATPNFLAALRRVQRFV